MLLEKNLRKKGKRYIHTHWNNKFEDIINIKERCAEANNRSEIGHWEINSIVSKKIQKQIRNFC